VKFFAPELDRALRGLSTLARDGKGKVRLSWTETTMTLGAKSEGDADIEMALPVTASAPGRIALNIGYLLEYLKGKQGLVTLAVKTSESPALLQHSASPLTVVMPMFTQWPGDPVPEKPPEASKEDEVETEVPEVTGERDDEAPGEQGPEEPA
jgi:DNA polymerase III sliding clamp (beta) subunit (PCNA family)